MKELKNAGIRDPHCAFSQIDGGFIAVVGDGNSLGGLICKHNHEWVLLNSKSISPNSILELILELANNTISPANNRLDSFWTLVSHSLFIQSRVVNTAMNIY